MEIRKLRIIGAIRALGQTQIDRATKLTNQRLAQQALGE